METNDIQMSQEGKLLINKQKNNDGEAGKVDGSKKVKGTEQADKKQEGKKKESHKNDNKAWLSQRVSELGEDKILYSSNSSGRHPYTREVLLLAELRGFKQVDMAEMCQVSQSQISQWLGGQSKATGEQLESLIDHISPLAPGKEFFIEEVVKRVTLSLPDDWEIRAVVGYLEKNARGMSNINESNIQRYALEGILAEERVALDGLHSQHEPANEELLLRKNHLEQLRSEYEDAQVDFEQQIEVWEESRGEYLASNPELADLDEEKRGKILDRHFPMPEQSKNEEGELISAIEDALGEKVSEGGLDDAYKVAFNQITDELSALSESYKLKYAEETAKWLREKESRQVFGRYSKEYDLNSIVLSENLHAIGGEFKKLAAELYGELKFTLAYEELESWEYDRRRHEIELNMSTVFTEYCKSLCSRDNSYDQYIDIESETVQVCGEIIFGEAKGKENTEESKNIRCYRLFSNKLALVFGYEYEEGKSSQYESDNDGYYKNIYVFDDAESVLEEAEGLLGSDKESEICINELSESLALFGYKTPGFRSIY
ncbi:Chromosome binding protein [Oleispira antarctica RB-8]|uniref:Chromosome binding protein n=1 Tax=Oleispira antarctica RB-8 TaxID=698738 RepID=R4YUY8_OLEAN|nr:Chromosome binding protein [Oleispira antarctica RB-8]